MRRLQDHKESSEFGPPESCGTAPFIPPPPSWAERPFHVAGRAMRKLIGLADGMRSTGAIAPSTLQNAGEFAVAAFHCGADTVTSDTGSPILETGILPPTRWAVQSASEITFVEAPLA